MIFEVSKEFSGLPDYDIGEKNIRLNHISIEGISTELKPKPQSPNQIQMNAIINLDYAFDQQNIIQREETHEVTHEIVTYSNKPLLVQTGPNSSSYMNLELDSMIPEEIGLEDGWPNVSDSDNAERSIGIIDQVISNISTSRSRLGSMQNRLEQTLSNLSNSNENLSSANSRISDVDMAHEIMKIVSNTLIYQASGYVGPG